MEPNSPRSQLPRAGRFAVATQVFGRQADSVVDYVNHGISVHIIGRRCSGRSALLGEVTSLLKAAGRSTFQVTGVHSWREDAFAAILAAGDDPTESHRPSEVAHAIIHSRLNKPGAVLICDDADELDPQSVGALAMAIREHRAVAVTTSLQTTRLQRQSLVAAISPAVSSRMAAADLATLQQIAVSVLGEPLEPDALAMLSVKSGGLIGLAYALLTVGHHQGRFARMSGGTYTINGDLWTDDLTWIAERLLAGATNTERDAARTLAEAGPVSFAQAESLLGKRHLRRLMDAGLTHLGEVGNRRLVSVFPPLLADYLLSEPNVSGPSTNDLKSTVFTKTIPAQSVALIVQRGMYDLAVQVRERRAAWGAAPSAETALALFLAMEQESGLAGAEIEEILSRTPLDYSDATANLLIWYIAYHTWRKTDPADAISRLAEYRKILPRYEPFLRAGQAHIAFLIGQPVEAREIAELMGSDDLFAASSAKCIELERLISLARSKSAAELIADFGEVDPRVAELKELLTCLNAVFGDNVASGTEESLRCVSDSQGSRRGLMRMMAYVAFEGLIISGRIHEAFTMVENIMALEPSAEEGSLVQTTLLNLGSMIAIWNDRPSFAQPLTRHASMQTFAGPLPGLNAGVSVAIELGVTDRDGAAAQLWRIASANFDKDYVLAGLFAVVMAIEYGPDSAGAIERLRAVGTLESPLAQAMAQFALAVADHDPAGIGAAAASFAGLGAHFFATRASVTQAIELRRNGQQSQAATVADAEWSRLKGLGLSNANAFARLREDVGLTSREFAILQLAATGVAYQDIAVKLDISVRTIETHLQNIGKKVGFTGRDKLGNAVRTWLKPPA